MPIERKQIETSLRKKGFVQEGGDHRYYYHEVEGKRTGAYTFISHGSGYKVYGDNLLKAMKIQLRLDSTNQVKRLLECPMDAAEYRTILQQKGII
ncbi:MAG: hypothetical protein M0Z67_11140 [Nitrospiraceae bacterium]|nr:hypothetical protein [Nitrospiraceae bacterium]